jgi:peptidyl-tRNA hydrolase, PTH1 family
VDPVIVAGLGNPGAHYAGTRHNVGFRVADELGRRHRAAWVPCAGPGLEARCLVRDQPVFLLKPLTFMNGSGAAVTAALDRHQVPAGRLLVVVDDIALPLGRLRMRPGGSDGGHNGLGSVIQELASEAFPRLRCGIAGEEPPAGEFLRDFVLSPFAPTEVPEAEVMIRRAADMVEEFAVSGIEAAMNICNSST